jgi:hypothetical protein
MPWTKRFEEEADYKLFGPQNRLGFYTHLDLRELLRGDFKSQNEGFEIMRRNGILSTNEWRERLAMNSIEGDAGDKLVMQSQYTTLEKIGETPAPNPSDASASSPASGQDDQADAGGADGAPSPEEAAARSNVMRRLERLTQEA